MKASYVMEGGAYIAHARLSYCVERVSPIARLVLLSLRLRLRDGQTVRMTTRALGQYAGVSASTVHTALRELVAYECIKRDENHRCITLVPLSDVEHDIDVQGNASKTHRWQTPHARMTESTEKLSKSARLTLISLRLRIKDEQTVSLTLRELAPFVGLCCASIAKALMELQAAGFVRWNKHVSEITVLPLPEVVRSRTDLEATCADLEDALADHEDSRDDHEDSRDDHSSIEIHASEFGAPMPNGAETVREYATDDNRSRSLREPASSYDHVQQQKDVFLLSQQPREPERAEAVALRLALSTALAQRLRTNPYSNLSAITYALAGRPDGTVAEFEEDLANAKARPTVYSPLGLVLSSWAEGKRVSPPTAWRHESARRSQRSRHRGKHHDSQRPIDPAALREMGFVGDNDVLASGAPVPVAVDAHPPAAPLVTDNQMSTWPTITETRNAHDLLGQAQQIAPDADAEELDMVAGELALGASAQAALERLHTQRVRQQHLPTLEQIVAQRAPSSSRGQHGKAYGY